MTETLTFAGRALGALVAAGLVTSEQIAAAGEAAGGDGAATARTLVDRGFVDDVQVAELLECELAMARVDLENYVPDVEALALVPRESAQAYTALPLFAIEGVVTIAISEPTDVFTLDALRAELGVELEPVLAERGSLAAAIERHYAGLEEAQVAHSEDDAPPPAPIAELDSLGADAGADASVDGDESPSGQAAALQDIFSDLDAHPEEPEQPSPELGSVVEPDSEPVPIEMASNVGEFDGQALGQTDETTEALNARILDDARTFDDAEALGDAATFQDAETPGASYGVTPPVSVAEVSSAGSAIDLDVLAVADERRVAVLVADILDLAVSRGASHIHVLPYKGDFFVAFRVGGRLETIASAPLSMQRPLVEGFKHYARVAAVPPTLPAVGRVSVEVAGVTRTLALSSVPTLTGQRLVVSLADEGTPRDLSELGLSDAEERALAAMAEQGTGLLLVAGPVSGGRSATYYSVLSRAAGAGRTVYSIERSVEHEIPAAAQVLVHPGSAAGSAAYLAAAMGQDTDVVGIDDIQSVEDAHLAVEAAGMGKLVVATFAGANVARAVRRLLGLGAEPASLAHALTLVVAQRLVRLNCPLCAVEDDSALADRIPDAPEGLSGKRSAGCDACGGSGYAGKTAIFEMLPITESVRAAIERGATSAQLEATSLAAGMRPFAASGLDKVEAGAVSAAEVDRVVRFSEAS